MKCLSCNEDKPESEFHKSSNNMRPTNYMCLDCYKEYHRLKAIKKARRQKEEIAEREAFKAQRIEREAKAAAKLIVKKISRTADLRVKPNKELKEKMDKHLFDLELKNINKGLEL